jgi:hypothetical protein
MVNAEPSNLLKEFIMENHIITGVGCFAGPKKLSRIFMRMVQTYTLGKLDGIEWINGHESDETEGTRLLKALIAGKAARLDTAVPDAVDRYENKKITGFFLTLKDQGLELSIFAKNGDCRRERHSAVLDEFTKVRQKRLN